MCALQPNFENEKREWNELSTSTRVMLFIEEMVNNKLKNNKCKFLKK